MSNISVPFFNISSKFVQTFVPSANKLLNARSKNDVVKWPVKTVPAITEFWNNDTAKLECCTKVEFESLLINLEVQRTGIHQQAAGHTPEDQCTLVHESALACGSAWHQREVVGLLDSWSSWHWRPTVEHNLALSCLVSVLCAEHHVDCHSDQRLQQATLHSVTPLNNRTAFSHTTQQLHCIQSHCIQSHHSTTTLHSVTLHSVTPLNSGFLFSLLSAFATVFCDKVTLISTFYNNNNNNNNNNNLSAFSHTTHLQNRNAVLFSVVLQSTSYSDCPGHLH